MRITSLSIAAADLGAQRRFYAEVLGLPVQAAGDGLIVQAGRSRLAMRPAPAGERPCYHIAFAVPFARLLAAHDYLAAHTPLVADSAGATMIEHAGWGARACYFFDPAGNILECIARVDEPADDPAAPPAPAIQSIAEAGIVTGNVPETTSALCARLGAPIFSGAGSPDFTAIGDRHGLLIIVRQGRIWYPDTGRAAAPAPLEAVVQTESGAHRVAA